MSETKETTAAFERRIQTDTDVEVVVTADYDADPEKINLRLMATGAIVSALLDRNGIRQLGMILAGATFYMADCAQEKEAMLMVGKRIGAILGRDETTVQLLGYGTFAGHEVPPDEGPASLTSKLHRAGKRNYKLQLDNGIVVWGCECWWASEDGVKAELARAEAAGIHIHQVTLEELNEFRGVTQQ